MKKLTQNIIVISSVFLLLLSSCGNEKKKESQNNITSEEPISKEVEAQVIFENEYAKVTKVSLAPGEFLSSHDGDNRVVYSLTDYSLDWEEKGENLGTKTWKKGDVHLHEAGKHAGKNIGATSAEWLVFTKKNTALPDCADNTIENDVNKKASEFAKVIFENQNYRITEVNLPKGKNIPAHSGINRIIYSLSDYKIMYEADKKGKVEKQFKVGDIHWHEACMHSIENNGDSDANYLVVSYKQNK